MHATQIDATPIHCNLLGSPFSFPRLLDIPVLLNLAKNEKIKIKLVSFLVGF